MTRFERIALTAGGLGLLRPAPGTWGSLPPVILAASMAMLDAPRWQIDVALVLFGLAFAIACLRFGAKAETTWGKKDPGRVVADEVAGQSIALLALPWVGGDFVLTAILASTAFFAFRAFDIIKPPPARSIQSKPGGVGILLDDLIAGVYASVIAQLVARVVVPAVVGVA